MTMPRQINPGGKYLLTRRTPHRQFLLTPTWRTNLLLKFCLGWAALKTGVVIHSVCVMSNHWHGVVTDPYGRLPEFLECFHRLVARAQNTFLGRREALWSSEKPSVVLLLDDEAVLEKMAYVIANPVQAGLVSSPEQWPGVITPDFDSCEIAPRPDGFFNPRGPLPAQLILQTTRPDIFPQLSDHELRERLKQKVSELVVQARRKLAAAGRRFVGARAVVRQSFYDYPRTEEAPRRIVPRVAASDAAKRSAGLRMLADFVRAYRAAWRAWRRGNRDVLFPPGTYALRVHAGVSCGTLAAA
jgi:putative transposase